jgi:hypothetical protein
MPGPLPLGVGQVPMWWMEDTPHNILDVDEAESRRQVESQMAIYYMQMAAADEAGLVGPDGKPLIGPDGKPLAWSELEWSRMEMGADGQNNFNIGDFNIDPKLFGISEYDPNYQAYLTGAKLPPGFFEKMQEAFGLGSANGQGKYGNEAEKFEPTWAKKKLRSTGQGEKIRQGIDELDSGAYKEHLRRLPGSDNPLHNDLQRRTSAPGKKLVRKTRKVRRSSKKPSAGADVRKRSSAGPPGSTHGGTKTISKGQPGPTHDVRKKSTTGPSQSGHAVKKNSGISSPPGSGPFATMLPVKQRTSFTGSPGEQRTSFTGSPEKQRKSVTGPPSSVPHTHFDATSSQPYKNNPIKPMAYYAKQPEPESEYHEEEYHEEEYVEEEYDEEEEYHEEEIVDDDYIDHFIDEVVVDEEFIHDEEMSYEEEVVSDNDDLASDDDDLVDLQAFLAEKHAELARLQEQLNI